MIRGFEAEMFWKSGGNEGGWTYNRCWPGGEIGNPGHNRIELEERMRNWRALLGFLCICLLLAGFALTGVAQQDNRQIGINVVLRIPVNPAVLASLGAYGRVRDIIPAIRAVTLQARASQLAAIRALPYVAAANPDAVRTGAPVDTVPADELHGRIEYLGPGRHQCHRLWLQQPEGSVTTGLAST